jgi:CHAP domain
MVVSLLRRSLQLAALVTCSAAFAASATPASARTHHHGARHHAHVRHVGHFSRRHFRQARSDARMSRWERGVAQLRAGGFADTQASLSPGNAPDGMATSSSFGGSSVVAEARRYIGGNPTSRASLWCARFMNMVLEHTGHRGTGSDMARSFASYGQRVSGPQVGAIAVMGRRGGGHVGVVSGNSGHRVRELPISRGRIYAYVMPN